MKLPLAYYGNPVLRKQCEEVGSIDGAVRQFVHDMIETLIEHNGIGLAAPQVNHSIKIFITAVPVEEPDGTWLPGKLRVYINPVITWVSEELNFRSEGCLSIPKVYGEVERPIKIKVQATDLDGKQFEVELEGLEARCVLHENDHINGVLFIDRIRGKQRQKLEPHLRQIKKMYKNLE